MAIPDFQTLMLPALRLGATGEIHVREAVGILEDEFSLTDEERKQLLPSGKMTTIRNRVTWAVTYLVKARLLHRPQRGVFTVTERGKKVLESPPERITICFLEQYPEFQEFRETRRAPNTPPEAEEEGQSSTPEERIDAAHTEINAALQDELLSKVLEASPEFFEKLIVRLLVSMGYGGSSSEAGKHLGRSGDGGVDGVINEDKLGLDIIYIQAKRFAPDNAVGSPEIQKFVGSLAGKHASKGVFVTTSSFSEPALQYTNDVSQRIILIDGERLTSLMLEHNVGVRTNQEIELKDIDEDFFME